YKTSLGIKIRALGESEEAAKSVGIKVGRVKAIALMISGCLSALGGMFLSMGYLSMFTANMVAGRGYIALATDAMSASHPIGSLASSMIYGFSDSVAVYLQKSNIPLECIQMFPYLFIIIVFTVFSYIKKRKNQESTEF
ncbi:MAG: ABC transporter permease subunit, partial [Cellulosilyticaceae bacterium]